MVEAWNDHFLVMTGRKFTDLFEEGRLPPVLANLLEKHKSVMHQLESIPLQPSVRGDMAKVDFLCSEGFVHLST